MTSIIGYLKSHPEVIWSGVGVLFLTLLGTLIKFSFNFFKIHMIIKKTEYQKLTKLSSNAINISDITKDLMFDHYYGIYIDKNTSEKFCPTCLTDKGKKNHLQEESTEFGTVYCCHVCHQAFRDKQYEQRMHKANQERYSFWD